ncbi:fatty acid desaturase [Rhizobium sp. ZPR3]|uniref:Fatty acid desaturase n=2 Tax=unclassified Rhizobium TaxID=2613769 RepID=A0AAU7SA05_9HYPH
MDAAIRMNGLSYVWKMLRQAIGFLLFMLFYLLYWAIIAIAASSTFILKFSLLDRVIKRNPYTATIATYILLTLASLGDNTFGEITGLLMSWLCIGAINVSASAFRSNKRRKLPDFVEIWFEKRLRQPLDIYFVRLTFCSSLLLIFPFLLIAFPQTVSLATITVYLFVLLRTATMQENIIHYDVHNHFFRWKHLKDGRERNIFQFLNAYVNLVVPLLSCRFPYHYTVEHLVIHHVENNSWDDVQSTLRYDRKSFLDFCEFALSLGMQVTFSFSWYTYLAKRKLKKPQRLIIRGQIIRYSILVILSLFNPVTATLLVIVPILSGIPRAVSIFFWHGLVDTKDPNNIYTNTINIDEQTGMGFGWHVEHHLRPGTHWFNQTEKARQDISIYDSNGVITYVPTPELQHLFLQAMWRRRFDLLAERCLPTDSRQKAALADLIEGRTYPLVPLSQPSWYRNFDFFLGRIASRALPGSFPISAAQL